MRALQGQVTRVLDRSEDERSEILEGSRVLLLLFGFADYFAQQHRVRSRRGRVEVAVAVFRRVFGDHQGIRMFGALQDAFRRPDAQDRVRDGFDAAYEFQHNGLDLVSKFFEGRLGDDAGR